MHIDIEFDIQEGWIPI